MFYNEEVIYMKFLQELYLGEKIAPKVDQIVKKIENDQEVSHLYLLVMASHPDKLLDLIPQKDILQKGYPKEELRVIGLAGNKKEAVKLVQSIFEESLAMTNSVDIRTYLEEKWEGQA